MADIHIHRAHTLGLDGARAAADRWVEDAIARYDMTCAITRGDSVDAIEFSRSGVSGTIEVAEDRFELTAKLGFLLSGFRTVIATEIEKNLDKLLREEDPKLPTA